jgi:hypothetical protein
MNADPSNPNIVHISTVSRKCCLMEEPSFFTENHVGGCCKIEFNPTYPIHLNGIISPSEFRESMEKLNRYLTSNYTRCILSWEFLQSIGFGLGSCAVGVIRASHSSDPVSYVLIDVGICLIGFGIGVLIGLGKIDLQNLIRLRKAVADESEKYSN